MLRKVYEERVKPFLTPIEQANMEKAFNIAAKEKINCRNCPSSLMRDSCPKAKLIKPSRSPPIGE